jgi:hypothetical protein
MIANESLAIGFCFTPTETAEAYGLVYDAMIEELRRNNEIPELSLVSNEAVALESFVRNLQFTWRLYHRHIIENFGSSGVIGSWVAGSLRSFSLEEYRLERKVIVNEVRAQEYDLNRLASQKIAELKWILFPNSCPSFAYQLDDCARWLLYSCRTTSNAAESIHAKLNCLKHGHDLSLRPILKVFSYCVRRCGLRNSEERRQHRASRKFYSLLTQSPDVVSNSRDPGRFPVLRASQCDPASTSR